MEYEIFDQIGNRIENYDPNIGRLEDGFRKVLHKAVKESDEVWHVELINEYPNGSKEGRVVIDKPGAIEREEWEETIPIKIFVPYSDEEIAALEEQRNKYTVRRIAALEEALELLLSGVTE